MLHVYCIGVVIDITKKLKCSVVGAYEVIGFCLFDCSTGKRKYVTRDGFQLYIDTKRESDLKESRGTLDYNLLAELQTDCNYVVLGIKNGQPHVSRFCSAFGTRNKRDITLGFGGNKLLVFDINKGYIPTGVDKIVIAEDRYYRIGIDLKDFSMFSEITGSLPRCDLSLYNFLSYSSVREPIFDGLGLEYKRDLEGTYYVTSGDYGFFCVYGDEPLLSFDLDLRRITLHLEVNGRRSNVGNIDIIIHNKVEEFSFSYRDNDFCDVTILISRDCRCKHSLCGILYKDFVEPLFEWAKTKFCRKTDLGKLAKAVLDMKYLYEHKNYDAVLEYKLLNIPYCQAVRALAREYGSVGVRVWCGIGNSDLYIKYI